MIQILVPLAGDSPFFPVDTYPFPKPLIEVGGMPMVHRVVDNLRLISREAKLIFVLRQEDADRYSLDRTLKLLAGSNCTTLLLRRPTRGALCSALMAIDEIDHQAPLIIANGDQVIDADLNEIVAGFVAEDVTAACITFESVHPRWSYALLRGNEVVQTAEKRVISRDAIAGFYFFQNGAAFVRAALRTIETDANVDGIFYVAPAFNELILEGARVVARAIRPNQYHSFYSPAKIREFEDAQAIKAVGSVQSSRPGLADMTIVIPAAGEGSRFRAAGFQRAKPFIDVAGEPMIQRVIDNVGVPGATTHVLLRTEHLKEEAPHVAALAAAGSRIHILDKTTEGTACTLLSFRKVIDNPSSLLVANSDQVVDMDMRAFCLDCVSRDLDGSIVVFREPTLNPKWSFARTDSNGLVVEVAEKKAISDLATVGIYLFRRGSDFVRAAIDMIARNDRVNGEFYTCPVYNYMIKNGARIGVFEIPRSAMHGLGTPEDLNAYLTPRGAKIIKVRT